MTRFHLKVFWKSLNLPISEVNRGHCKPWKYFHITVDTLPQSSAVNLLHKSDSGSEHFHFYPKEFSWQDLAWESVCNIHGSNYPLKQHNLSIKEIPAILSPSIFWPHQIHLVAAQIRKETVLSFLPSCLTFAITVLGIICVDLQGLLSKTKLNESLHLNIQDAYSPTEIR